MQEKSHMMTWAAGLGCCSCMLPETDSSAHKCMSGVSEAEKYAKSHVYGGRDYGHVLAEAIYTRGQPWEAGALWLCIN